MEIRLSADLPTSWKKATVDVIESGRMTKDLALITSLENPVVLNSQEFIQEIRKELEK